MNKSTQHTFHIPVMGLGYTIDTPVKVARFGISSVVSVIEDELVEQMRKFYCGKENQEYTEIKKSEIDHRANRITNYLNLLNKIVEKQIAILKSESFDGNNEIEKYFRMLPSNSHIKKMYDEMKSIDDPEIKKVLQKELIEMMEAGSIDVNIMTKLDNINYSPSGEALPVEYADAMAALRGFALSDLSSSIVFSAGLNPRLYSYCESFKDFFPDENGKQKKKIILKVSDYRSALIQGKFLAKKGLWVSEFRIESGLNCGGHAFPTDGILVGPILEEFRMKRNELEAELLKMCNAALLQKGKQFFLNQPKLKISFQGGIGTASENKFLHEYYNIDATGWGSPFLLVPEATNVDEKTLHELAHAKPDDYYLSHASPLGIPFNNFRKSSSEEQRHERIMKNRAGSPCYKKYLSFNTEFTKKPICIASREYQNLKIIELANLNLSEKEYAKRFDEITEKDCLCEGLSSSALLKNHLPVSHHLEAVTICPGPNLAYFSGIFSLEEMVDHIYGRKNILNQEHRPHMFIKELQMYVDYLKKEIDKSLNDFSAKKEKYFTEFKSNLLEGIEYYKQLLPKMSFEIDSLKKSMEDSLNNLSQEIVSFLLPEKIIA